MLHSQNYTPILKWKQGEQFALMYLNDEVKAKIAPYFSMVDNEDPDKLISKIYRFWGNVFPFYLGFHQNVLENASINKSKIISELIEVASTEEMPLVPVISSYNDKAYYDMIKKSKDMTGNGILLHVRPHDFKRIDELVQLVESIGIEEIDILIDWYSINQGFDVETYVELMSEKLKKIAKAGFRKIIFAASSFPEMLSGIDAFSISTIERTEWKIWKGLKDQYPDIHFGDYSIDDPLNPTFSQGVTIVPTIRYTKDDYWYIVRGKHDPSRPRDFTQYHKLSKMLVEKRNIYCGREYSWGDEEIFLCAEKKCTGAKCNHGHMLEWVKRSANHHLTYVANQVSSYPVV